MITSLKSFKEEFLEEILEFLWRQWSQMGVAGHAGEMDRWIIDPEAFLLFTMEIGRYDARLFDEVIDWLKTNGEWINVRRLRNLMRKDKDYPSKIPGAIANILIKEDRSAKWKILSVESSNHVQESSEPLFYGKDGKHLPIIGKEDEIFLEQGLCRSPINLRGLSQKVRMHLGTNLIFKLRALFGITTRVEIIAYLLTHETTHPRAVAREIEYSQKGVQDTMKEMVCSELLSVRSVGKEKQYRLVRSDLWAEFLGLSPKKIPQWVNWPSFLRGLIKIWRLLNIRDFNKLSSYLRSSELRRLMREVRAHFEKSHLNIIITDDRNYRGEQYTDVFLKDIKEIFKKLSIFLGK